MEVVMQRKTKHINSLTGLRFFAAAGVVIFHTNLNLVNSLFFGELPLSQCVTLFFVLSGFILTYVYPKLEKRKILHFYRARVARIWPAHIAGLTLVCLIMHQYVQFWNNRYLYLLTASMTNSWIPIQRYALSCNAPSWSIGTEFFFYLCFPLLIYKFNKTWHVKLLATLSLPILFIWLCYYFKIPMMNDNGIDTTAIMRLNPLSRLFEFTLGMCIALLFSKASKLKQLTYIQGSLLEIAVIMALYYSLKYNDYTFYLLFNQFGNIAGQWWATCVGSIIPIGFVILVLAAQRGIVSSFLASRPLILLGEISYSIYLTHWTFLGVYNVNKEWFKAHFHPAITYLLFWCVLLLTSYLIWRFIEKPFRKLLMTDVRRRVIQLPDNLFDLPFARQTSSD